MNEVVQVRLDGWAAMVRQRNESGMTVKKWCSANGISENAYYYRLRQLRKSILAGMETNDTDSPQQFAHVRQQTSEGVAVRIRRGDTTIEIDNQASGTLLDFLKEVLIHAV